MPAVCWFGRIKIPDVRDTNKGQVMGFLNETNMCREWRGIYFAADTGGANRWLAPQPRQSWAPAVLDGTKFAAGELMYRFP